MKTHEIVEVNNVTFNGSEFKGTANYHDQKYNFTYLNTYECMLSWSGPYYYAFDCDFISNVLKNYYTNLMKKLTQQINLNCTYIYKEATYEYYVSNKKINRIYIPEKDMLQSLRERKKQGSFVLTFKNVEELMKQLEIDGERALELYNIYDDEYNNLILCEERDEENEYDDEIM